MKEKLRAGAQRLKRDIPAVLLALKDPRTPAAARLLAALTALYALSPVDLIPDFVPVLGYLDDLIILPLMVSAVLRLLPEPVLDDCRRKASAMVLEKKWYCALPFVAVWLLLALLILKAVMTN